MPEKSASIAQQRLMGMAYAARTGRLDTSKIEDKEWREKVEKIAKSKNFSDDTLHKMASTKYRDPKTKKLIPYLIGKGTPEEPEKMRRPYKKKNEELVPTFEEFQHMLAFYDGYVEALHLMESTDIPTFEMVIANILPNNPGMNVSYSGAQPVKYYKNLDQPQRSRSEPDDDDDDEESEITSQHMQATQLFKGNSLVPTYEEFLQENITLNPGMNVQGMGPVAFPGNPGTSTGFHTQTPGSGDMPVYPNPYIESDEDEDEDEDDKKKKARADI